MPKEQKIESLTKDLIERYGFTLLKSDLIAALRIQGPAIAAIPEDKLPRMRFRGRGGNRYLARDVAAFMVEKMELASGDETAAGSEAGRSLDEGCVPA